MPNDWSPSIRSKSAPPVEAPVAKQELTIVVKADAPPPVAMQSIRGWRFVPHRGPDNLIDEIIATPIIE